MMFVTVTVGVIAGRIGGTAAAGGGIVVLIYLFFNVNLKGLGMVAMVMMVLFDMSMRTVGN
jgi:hypothetical protein